MSRRKTPAELEERRRQEEEEEQLQLERDLEEARNIKRLLDLLKEHEPWQFED